MTNTSRRRRTLAAVCLPLVGAVLLATGWCLAEMFQSPAQREAAARPPAPAAVTSAVERGGLSKTISARATLQRESTRLVAVPARGDASVVTKAPIALAGPIDPGAVVLEVDGRPIFALPGGFAFYRDLSPGMSGPDVKQLQDGLRSAGIDVGVDGSFGGGTERAVRQLYSRSGYSVPRAAAPVTDDRVSLPGIPLTTDAEGPLVIPRQEFLVVDTLPAFLGSILSVGTPITADTTVSVEEGAIVAIAQTATSAGTQLEPGTSVVLTREGAAARGKVRSIERDTSASDHDETKKAAVGDVSVTIEAEDGSSFDVAWVHAEMLAEFRIAVAEENALIVPSRSVNGSADGTGRVLKQLKDGSFREVRVRESGALDGRSAVIPLTEGELAVGDLVKVS